MVVRTAMLALLIVVAISGLAEAQVSRTVVRDGRRVLGGPIKPPLGSENRITFEGAELTLAVRGRDGMAAAATMSNDGDGTIITVEESDEDGNNRRQVTQHVAVRRSNVRERVNLVVWLTRDKHLYFIRFEAKSGAGGSVLVRVARTDEEPAVEEVPASKDE